MQQVRHASIMHRQPWEKCIPGQLATAARSAPHLNHASQGLGEVHTWAASSTRKKCSTPRSRSSLYDHLSTWQHPQEVHNTPLMQQPPARSPPNLTAARMIDSLMRILAAGAAAYAAPPIRSDRLS